MKRIVCLCVILLCSISFVFAQSGSGRVTKKRKPVAKKKIDPQIAEAEKAWLIFYEKFREVVKNKNRKGLYDIMAEDFYFPCAYDGGYGYQGEGVGRSFEIKKFDGPTERDFDCGGWEKLEAFKEVSPLLLKGKFWASEKYLTKIVGKKWVDNGKEQSPCLNSKRDNNSCEGYWARFEFRDGEWYLAAFDFCECE